MLRAKMGRRMICSLPSGRSSVRRATVAFMEVRYVCSGVMAMGLTHMTGIGPKVTQSVITAAFLFAFKDALYNYTIQARKTIARK